MTIPTITDDFIACITSLSNIYTAFDANTTAYERQSTHAIYLLLDTVAKALKRQPSPLRRTLKKYIIAADYDNEPLINARFRDQRGRPKQLVLQELVIDYIENSQVHSDSAESSDDEHKIDVIHNDDIHSDDSSGIDISRFEAFVESD